jgi:small multidrug resistance pump/quaternary ammonium compound-resistance protein SugE
LAIKILLSITAALFFALGGMLMKPSEGLTRLWPSAGVFALFAVGAALNIVLVRMGEDVGPAYLAVAGAETVVALFLAWLIYGERIGSMRLGAALLISIGVVVLAADQGSGDTRVGEEPAAGVELVDG